MNEVWIVFSASSGGIGFPFTMFASDEDAQAFVKRIAAYSTLPVKVVHAVVGEPVTGI